MIKKNVTVKHKQKSAKLQKNLNSNTQKTGNDMRHIGNDMRHIGNDMRHIGNDIPQIIQAIPQLPKEFAPVLRNCRAELNSYNKISAHTKVLMDILILADPCISKYTLKIEIINNKAIILHAPPTSAGLFKRRSDGIIIMLEQTLQHYFINDCTLYIHVKDTYINYDEPFFIYARPVNKKGLLCVDHSWIDAEPEKKISKEKGGELISINDIRTKAHRVTGPRNKKNSLFFIGQNVPLIRSNDFFFRKYFAGLKWPFEVKTTGYLNMGEYSKWKYLLNLPGWYPWSFRFKFLFLMNSFIININLLRPELDEGKWINIIDSLFMPGRDFIEIDYAYDPQNMATLESDIIEVFKKYNYSKQDFDKIVENGRKKGELITLENILVLNATIYNNYALYIKNKSNDYEPFDFYNALPNNYNIMNTSTPINLGTPRSPSAPINPRSPSNKIIFDYKSKLTTTKHDLLYSNNSKIFKLSDNYVLKCYPCSLYSYNELKTYEKLNNKHNGFPKIYDSFIDNSTLYLLIDFIDINLQEYISAFKITKNTWKKIKAELFIIITRLHSLNICHNNIKPENILYSYKKDQFYFIDFKESSIINFDTSIECDLDNIKLLEQKLFIKKNKKT